MLNKFQKDILMYFGATNEHFIFTLMDKNTGGFLIIDNLVSEVIAYLGSMIKRDLALHAERSIGYNQLEDMLIEIHIQPSDEFSDALFKKALEPVQQNLL